jgi:hypothetical protein
VGHTDKNRGTEMAKSRSKAESTKRLAESGHTSRLVDIKEAAAYYKLSESQFRKEWRGGTVPDRVKGLQCKQPRWDVRELDLDIDARTSGVRSGDPIMERIRASHKK